MENSQWAVVDVSSKHHISAQDDPPAYMENRGQKEQKGLVKFMPVEGM